MPAGVVAAALLLALSWMIVGRPTPVPAGPVDPGIPAEVDVAVFGVG